MDGQRQCTGMERRPRLGRAESEGPGGGWIFSEDSLNKRVDGKGKVMIRGRYEIRCGKCGLGCLKEGCGRIPPPIGSGLGASVGNRG